MDFALGKLLSRAFGRPSEATARTVPDVAQPAAWLAGEAGTGIESKFGQPNSIELPLPDERLRSTVIGPELDRFLYIGSTWAAVCLQYLPAREDVTVLDIGCGVGKMARFLALNPALHYVGFDIYLPAIEWCRREFSRVYPGRFRFEHFEGRSAMYNPGGKLEASEYRFPVDESTVDLALGASIFIHLYERDMRHYFDETARVLKPGGVALFSINTVDEAPAFFPDAVVSPGNRILGNEQVMLVDKDYFADMGRAHGLDVLHAPGRLCGQELIVFRKYARC